MEARINILLVDDYPANLIALSAVLSNPVYTLIEASSGAEALKVLATTDVALVLLDIQMPEMDGYEVARQIRANPRMKNLPIIFITAVYREEPSVRKGYEAGGHDYVGKPFDPEILKAKVGIYSALFAKSAMLEQRARQLEESEERYRLIVEGAREIIATIDNEGTISTLNLAFERLTGLKASEWVGRSFIPLVPPDDVPNVLAHFSRSRADAAAHPDDPALLQTQIHTARNEWMPVEISVQPLLRDGVDLGMVGVMRDISARVPSSKRA